MNIRFSCKCANEEINTYDIKENTYSCDYFSIISKVEDGRTTITLNPLVEMSNLSIIEIKDIVISDKTRYYSNGFQSWSFSREYMVKDKQKGINKLLKPTVRKAGGYLVGDYSFVKYPTTKGVFNSVSHTYFRQKGENTITLYGTMNERNGYTYFTADLNKSKLYVTKELEGLTTSTPIDLIDYTVIEDEYNSAFDRYFKLLNINSRTKTKLKGYTSWYNYYRNINEKIILDDLDGIVKAKEVVKDINIFQIDDGYQPYVGDIVEIDTKKFPNGLKPIVDKIHDNGLLAGLWTCPFGATKQSNTYKNHFDWILKDDSGKPIKVGAAWKGFYCLDFYNPAVREYVRQGIATMLNDWGFDMLKMDFLYCVATHPRNNKTRATIMYEAMEFLRECTGDKLILGCGVPLMPAFGLVDYCRIGADASLSYAFPLDHAINCEIISTRKTMLNTLFRRYLDGRVFMNDPDVFILRDYNNSMTSEQQLLLATVNKLCGSVLFCSDNVNLYNDNARKIFNFAMDNKKIIINDITMEDKKIVSINYTIDDINRILVYNYLTSEILLDKTTTKTANI